LKAPIEHITLNGNLALAVLRLDKLHPLYGGNKLFKLKYNLPSTNTKPIITFGGKNSNHIYATAAFCNEHSIKCFGIIRGEENAIESSTLQFATTQGMNIHFVNRASYLQKEKSESVQTLLKEYPNAHIIPEGGDNAEGVKGCMEILSENLNPYKYIFCACGTATTFTGLLAALKPHQILIGCSVLKGENKLLEEVNKYAAAFNFSTITIAPEMGEIKQSTILNNYCFGGYAKHTEELLKFKTQIEKQFDLPLDYLYTSKLLFAIKDLMQSNRVNTSEKCIMIHSGGLQGNEDYEKRYGLKLMR
jgi:1-aminocyclopropane-1-carboxylate deaminase